jgi:glycosyltransferase involved in cell wall biosynthesis
MAQLFFAALKAADHDPFIASTLVTFEPTGNRRTQADLARQGAAIAKHLVAGYRGGEALRPALWFTYHLYHKASDWIGPVIAEALQIPYVVAEASLAQKRQDGPWAIGYDGALRAARAADLILAVTANDEAGLRSVLGPDAPIRRFAPFVEPHDSVGGRSKSAAKASLARIYPGLNPAMPWLLTVAMMREGSKTDCYMALGRALKSLFDNHPDQTWQFIACGDGPARGDIEASYWDLPGGRIALLGEADRTLLDLCYQAADIYVWPGYGEAYGVAYLEAASAGLPAVACAHPGVMDVVRNRQTGLLVTPDDAHAFADAVAKLLSDQTLRLTMGGRAHDVATELHGFDGAVETLRAILPTRKSGGAVRTIAS